MAKKTEWPGAFNAFEAAYKRITQNAAPAWFFVGVYSAAHIVSMVLQGKTYGEKGYVQYANIVMLVLVLPMTVYALSLAQGKTMTIGELMNINAKKLLLLIVTSILAAFIIMGSILLLVFPVIWTVAWFAMSVYVLVDRDDTGPIQALQESKRISQEHKGKVWGVIGVSILVSIAASVIAAVPYVGVVAVAAGTVWTTVASALLYTWLKDRA